MIFAEVDDVGFGRWCLFSQSLSSVSLVPFPREQSASAASLTCRYLFIASLASMVC